MRDPESSLVVVGGWLDWYPIPVPWLYLRPMDFCFRWFLIVISWMQTGADSLFYVTPRGGFVRLPMSKTYNVRCMSVFFSNQDSIHFVAVRWSVCWQYENHRKTSIDGHTGVSTLYFPIDYSLIEAWGGRAKTGKSFFDDFHNFMIVYPALAQTHPIKRVEPSTTRPLSEPLMVKPLKSMCFHALS